MRLGLRNCPHYRFRPIVVRTLLALATAYTTCLRQFKQDLERQQTTSLLAEASDSEEEVYHCHDKVADLEKAVPPQQTASPKAKASTVKKRNDPYPPLLEMIRNLITAFFIVPVLVYFTSVWWGYSMFWPALQLRWVLEDRSSLLEGAVRLCSGM
jgi:hypothetical protein